jgi:predicted nucleotide-binding protein
MYNAKLAAAILGVLRESFPRKITLTQLKNAVPEFSKSPEDEWLYALDALEQKGLAAGSFVRSGHKNKLIAVMSMGVTALGLKVEHIRSPDPLEDATEGREKSGTGRTDARTVFVIHGRDERLRSGLFDFLRSIDLMPLEWAHAVEQTKKGTPYVGEILDAAFSRAQAIVVLLTPDDEVRLRKELRAPGEVAQEFELEGQARPNVLFEAGMAMARSPERTILVEIGNLRPFSDVGGRHAIRMDNSFERRQLLANRLRTAGCTVNLTGTDWHKKGDLTPP